MPLRYSAHLTCTQFRQLLGRAQLLYLFTEGTYLAQRREQASLRRLYYLPDGGRGFFTEVVADATGERFVVLGSFTSSARLAEYAAARGTIIHSAGRGPGRKRWLQTPYHGASGGNCS